MGIYGTRFKNTHFGQIKVIAAILIQMLLIDRDIYNR